MKRILAGAVGGAAVLAAVFGAGSANADNEYAGQTYEKAAASISQWGKAVIASRVGDYLPTDQCIVTRSRSGNFLDSSGNGRGGEVLLYLNCNDVSAQGGHSGNSVTTPTGKRDQEQRQSANELSEDYAAATAAGEQPWCEKNADQCYNFCEKTGYCSAELNEFLGL